MNDWLWEHLLGPTLTNAPSPYRFVLHSLALGMKSKTIVECGVQDGWSSAFLAFAAKETGGHVWGIDIHDSDVPRERIKELGLNNYWTYIIDDALTHNWEHGEIDFLFIDDNHDSSHIRQEIEIWYPRMRKNRSIIAFHDTRPLLEGEVAYAIKRQLLSSFRRDENYRKFFFMNCQDDIGLGIFFLTEGLDYEKDFPNWDMSWWQRLFCHPVYF